MLLAGCGQAESDPGPGGVTVGEARALDEAAEMLEQRRLPPDVLRGSESDGLPSSAQDKTEKDPDA